MMQTLNMNPTSDSIPTGGPSGGVARAPLRLSLRLTVSLGDADCARVPAAAFDLLRRMPRVDSLREAASGFGLSYRHAWALIRDAEQALGAALIVTRRGHGTQLTPYGALLAAALEEIESRLAPELDAATQALSAAVALGAPVDASAASTSGRGEDSAQARR